MVPFIYFSLFSCTLLSRERFAASTMWNPTELKNLYIFKYESAKLWQLKLYILVKRPRVRAHTLSAVNAGSHPSTCLPRVLVAMSATFWKASKKAAAATTVVLRCKQKTKAWGMSHTSRCKTAKRLQLLLRTESNPPGERTRLDMDNRWLCGPTLFLRKLSPSHVSALPQ